MALVSSVVLSPESCTSVVESLSSDSSVSEWSTLASGSLLSSMVCSSLTSSGDSTGLVVSLHARARRREGTLRVRRVRFMTGSISNNRHHLQYMFVPGQA